MLQLGFKSSYEDLSLFVKYDGKSIIVLLLYVDDIILTDDSGGAIQDFSIGRGNLI